ncbi:MAG: coproporphyrinogen dehydrogenase HemZ [Clostridia bacterium]|nr:coproporphyrinogen dehydrogenase HemZ [Clostridia bacterium]
MIRLTTNEPGFANDLAEEIRLFLPAAEVFADAPRSEYAQDEVRVLFEERGGAWIARAEYLRGCDVLDEYVHSAPAVEGSALLRKRHAKRCMKVAVFRLMRKRFPEVCVPWGSLTGIRPTRLFRELERDVGSEAAIELLRSEFDVEASKLRLVREIADVQRPILAAQTARDVDVYIGIPFCKTRCLYCSFASSIRTASTDMEAYLNALFHDIELGAKLVAQTGRRVRCMYVGGGTPTVLTAAELDALLSRALAAYGASGVEFTVEAGRPDTIDAEKLDVMRAQGVSRISVNPQTMNAHTLELVGRRHSVEAVEDAVALARAKGFSTVNMDVIVGLPNETAEDVARTMERIVALAPENLTVHTLAIKRSSALKAQLCEYDLPDADVAEEMVMAGYSAAQSLKMRPYYMYRQKYMRGNLENVGYAREGAECVYNVDMMEDTTSIMAHGAGAMTKVVYDAERRIERVANPKDIATYIQKVERVYDVKRALFGG